MVNSAARRHPRHKGFSVDATFTGGAEFGGAGAERGQFVVGVVQAATA
jgi:hypothetical protein